MKVLYFTNKDVDNENDVPEIISQYGDEVLKITKRPTLEIVKQNNIDFIVSDRPRFIIKPDLIKFLKNKIINLHPSFLPWNRGYNPNFWSIYDNTPHGVTIHYIDEGIDTGNILAQIKLYYSENDTFKTTYDRCRYYMIELFRISWPLIKENKLPSIKQDKQMGTFHYKKDLNPYYNTLENGWNTKIKNLIK